MRTPGPDRGQTRSLALALALSLVLPPTPARALSLRAPPGASRREALGWAAAIAGGALAGPAAPAAAFCGAPYPRWTYFADWDETLARVSVPGIAAAAEPGVYVRCLGDKKEERKAKANPLLIIPGGPGLPHDYLETLEGVAGAGAPRRVIDFDPLLTGKSAEYMRMVAASNAKKGREMASEADFGDAQRQFLREAAGQAAQARAAGSAFLQKENRGLHVLGHGAFGAAAGLRLLGESLSTAGSSMRVVSLTLASPLARSGPKFNDGVPVADASVNYACVDASVASAAGGLAASSDSEGRRELLSSLGALEAQRDVVRASGVPVYVTLTGAELKADAGAADDLAGRLEACFGRVEAKRYQNNDELVHLARRDDYVEGLVAFLDDADGYVPPQ
mmetsp:Transcript_4172/g.12155  ORF Transcript_4172/g.12155 Transcript_4172/m.12155 type:complete len:392 (-) Transcript_4172:75-1250(-)